MNREIEEFIKRYITEENYYYWRECPNCGYAGGGYLHCCHDKVQNGCHNCGKTMPVLKGECSCYFVIEEKDLKDYLQNHPNQ